MKNSTRVMMATDTWHYCLEIHRVDAQRVGETPLVKGSCHYCLPDLHHVKMLIHVSKEARNHYVKNM